jgi:membrane protease YdiL (CAAX protease family)
MRAPEFEASLHDAALYPQLWRLALGTLLAGSVLIVGVAVAVVAGQQGAFGIMPFLNGLATPDRAWEVLLLLGTFAGLFAGALVAAAALHFRGPDSLFGPWAEWRAGFLTALGVLVPIYGVLMALTIGAGGAEANLALGRWLSLLPLALPLLFLQIAAEELFFRGYLQQQLAARFRARWIWMWIPAVIFAVLHTNPQAGENLPLVLLAALTFGLVAADLTERTGSLGAAMGLHFGNNFFGLLVVAAGDTLTGLALFTSPTDIGAAGPQSLSIAGSILLMLLVWWITARLLDR